MSDIEERLRERARSGFAHDELDEEAADEIARLREALRNVIENIEDYERVNNLSPSPGRKYCWDTVAHAHKVLGDE